MTMTLQRKGLTDAEVGLKWLAANWERVAYLARKACRGRYDLIADLIGEAVDRVTGIASNYEPALGSQDAHMITNLRWYMFKWMNANAKRLSRHSPLGDSEEWLPGVEHQLPDLDGKDLVQEVLAGLSELDRTLLLLYHAHGMTHEEIGRRLGVSKGTARLHCIRALEAAQALAAECDEDDY